MSTLNAATLPLYPKPSFEAFIQTCTPLAILPLLEQQMAARVEAIVQNLLAHQHQTDLNPIENLVLLLRADESFLGVLLAWTNLSQEKFLRILSAERFSQGDYGNEWGIEKVQRKLQTELAFAERIAHLFIDGRNDPLLAQNVAQFYLEQLTLFARWDTVLGDHEIIRKVVRRKLMGEYTDKKGDEIERQVRAKLDEIETRYGITHGKGQVASVNKEVDHVVPATDDPFVLIMTSYMETTSSSQTDRADKQAAMYHTLQTAHGKFKQRVFVNFVDGAGWLARRSDLLRLHKQCDYIVNLNTLDRLEAIICQYVPEKFFTRQARPTVKEVTT